MPKLPRRRASFLFAFLKRSILILESDFEKEPSRFPIFLLGASALPRSTHARCAPLAAP